MIKKIILLITVCALSVFFYGCPTEPPDSGGYRVYYNGNGASGGDVPVDDNVYIPDPDGVTNLVTVSGNTGSLYKDGYDFAGWSSLANGTGALLSAGDEFLIMDSDVTLYAQWAVATHSVTYDANGADSGLVPSYGYEFETGWEVTVLGNTGGLVRDGYIFTGWNTDSGGNATNYDADDTFDMGTSDVILYADWVAPAFLTQSDLTADDLYGQRVDMTDDYLIIGAPYNDEGAANSGAVYIYERTGRNTWVQEPKIQPDDSAADCFFGGSVAIDGDYAVVGAYSDDNGGSTINNYGAAYVFKRSYAGIWEQQQKLRAESPGFGDYYGTSVAIFGDYIIVGAEEADVTRDLAVYPDAGAAYVYHRTGDVWGEEAPLIVSDCQQNDSYGHSVAIGDYYAVICSYNVDSGAGGAVMFKQDETTGVWDAGTDITPTGLGADDRFGCSAAASGHILIIGAEGDDSSYDDSGVIYFYLRGNPEENLWNTPDKITLDEGVDGYLDRFGCSVDVCGMNIVAGILEDDDAASDAGAVVLITLNAVYGFDNVEKIEAPDGAVNDAFGHSTAVSDNYLAGTALSDDYGGTTNCGSVWIFPAD